MPYVSPKLLRIQGQGYKQLVALSSHCGKQAHSHIPVQAERREIKKHSDLQLVPTSSWSIQIEIVSAHNWSIHACNMICLSHQASVKRQVAADRLLLALDELFVVELIVKLQHHLPKQEIYCLLLCFAVPLLFAVPLHHVSFVHHILFVSCALALQRWPLKHPHVQDQSQSQKMNLMNLMLLKGSELLLLLVVVVEQESMSRSR